MCNSDKYKWSWRNLWLDYRSEFFFGVVLFALVVFSFWAASFIPEQLFENVINPIENVATAVVCFFGGWLMARHHEGNRLRIAWGRMLWVWGLLVTALIVARYYFHITAIGGTPDDPLYNASLIVGNIIAWMLFVYPSLVLMPGWLNWTRAILLILPMIILGVIDYFLQVNLIFLIMGYPVFIFAVLCAHIRTYRRWCEDNFSTMDDIDAQWVVRYLVILALLGVSFYFICFWYLPNRMFTQQWVLLLILTYGTEQILFRKDPWEDVRPETDTTPAEPDPASDNDTLYVEEARVLEQWMISAKPYTNPDFRLQDIYQVLPKNRTYLSKILNDVYGCSFYHWVNRYRLEEAKRILTEHPDSKICDVALDCGFSSATVFSRAFSRDTGMSPREWSNLKR